MVKPLNDENLARFAIEFFLLEGGLGFHRVAHHKGKLSFKIPVRCLVEHDVLLHEIDDLMEHGFPVATEALHLIESRLGEVMIESIEPLSVVYLIVNHFDKITVFYLVQPFVNLCYVALAIDDLVKHS